jgi:hypothetical protein
MELLAGFNPETPIVLPRQPWLYEGCRITDYTDVGWTDEVAVMALYQPQSPPRSPDGREICGCYGRGYRQPGPERLVRPTDRAYGLIVDTGGPAKCWPALGADGHLNERNVHGEQPMNRAERRAAQRAQHRSSGSLPPPTDSRKDEAEAEEAGEWVEEAGEPEDFSTLRLLSVLAMFDPDLPVAVPRQPWLSHPCRVTSPADVGWTEDLMVTALYHGGPEGDGPIDCGCGAHSYRTSTQLEAEGQPEGHVYALLVESDEFRTGMMRSWPYFDEDGDLNLHMLHGAKPVP